MPFIELFSTTHANLCLYLPSSFCGCIRLCSFDRLYHAQESNLSNLYTAHRVLAEILLSAILYGYSPVRFFPTYLATKEIACKCTFVAPLLGNH
jgi:hypothetical protein